MSVVACSSQWSTTRWVVVSVVACSSQWSTARWVVVVSVVACSSQWSTTVVCYVLSCYFSFQSMVHDWCNKGRGMCYPVCGMVHIKEHFLLIEKSSPYGSIRFPLSLSEWSITICLTPNNTVN